MATTSIQIAWLAGLLEGEGSFFIGNSPAIKLAMTDLDTVRKARDIMNPKTEICTVESKIYNRQPLHQFSIFSTRSAEWMMTIYPLMSQRRQAKIKEVLSIWKTMNSNKRKTVQ